MQIESSRFEQMGAIATAIAEDTISQSNLLSFKPTIFYPNNNEQCIRVGAELKTAHIVQPRETFSDNGRIEANQGSNAACVDAVLSLKRGTMDTTLLSSSVLLSRSVFLTLLFSVFCMMSIVADGLDIVDVGEDGWKVGAVKMLQGAVVKGGGGSGGGVLEQTKERPVRKELHQLHVEYERRLSVDDCDAFVKGNAFNMVNVDSCNLKSTTTIDGGQTLRIRGRDDLNHPNLMRGGQAGGDIFVLNGDNKIRSHHFVLNGDSRLTLMNLKLSGAWSGHVASQCGWDAYTNTYGYCAYYQNQPGNYCNPNCNDYDKGGAIRIQSGTSTTLIIDVIFENNKAAKVHGQTRVELSSGNIFATSSSAKLYLMNMPIPTEIAGITPIYKCDAAPTNFCSDFFADPCVLDTTSNAKRVFCTCKQGSYGNRSNGGTTLGSCQTCENGKTNNGTGNTICAFCPPGRVLPFPCTACTSGKYQDELGFEELSCKACVAGRYSISGPAQTSIGDCLACAEGRYSTVGAGQTSSIAECDNKCSAGKWSDEVGLTSDAQCLGTCSQGRYSSQTGLTSDKNCTVCSGGKYSNQKGLSSSDDCVSII